MLLICIAFKLAQSLHQTGHGRLCTLSHRLCVLSKEALPHCRTPPLGRGRGGYSPLYFTIAMTSDAAEVTMPSAENHTDTLLMACRRILVLFGSI